MLKKREDAVRTFLGLMMAGLVVLAGAGAAMAADPVEKKPFGMTADGQDVDQYILTNAKGSQLKCITYGAIITKLIVPDKNGKMGDVVLGYDEVKQYEMSVPSMCCVVGRFANRIAGGQFTIDGTQYAVTMNQGQNCLHGGMKGLGKRLWKGDAGTTPDGPTVRFTILDPDGAEGFPGNLTVQAIYTLTNDDILKVQFFARTDKATPVNLSQHAYFNLSGTGKGDNVDYIAKFYATHYLPMDAALIPTGEIVAVAGTPFDFTKAKLIGKDIKPLPGIPPGYDHTLVLDNPKGQLMKAAEVYDPVSGRLLETLTTEPAVHFSNGRNLGGVVGKGGEAYAPYRGFSIETQHYSDSPNHPDFPSTILRPGQTYRQLSEYKFSVPVKPMEAE